MFLSDGCESSLKGNKSPKPPELDARTPSPVVHTLQFNSVQSLSRVRLFVTPLTAACQASLSITNSQSLFKLMSIESGMPSNHLILCHHLLLRLQSFPASVSFVMSQFVTSGGHSIGVSASASVLPVSIQDWSSVRLTGVISYLSSFP